MFGRLLTWYPLRAVLDIPYSWGDSLYQHLLEDLLYRHILDFCALCQHLGGGVHCLSLASASLQGALQQTYPFLVSRPRHLVFWQHEASTSYPWGHFLLIKMSWQAESPGSDWQQTLPWSSLVGLHFSDFWSHWQKIFWGLPAWHALWDRWSQRWSIQHTASVTLPWQLKSGWRRSSIHSSAVEVDTNRKVKTAKLDLLHILPRRLFHVDCKKIGFRWQQWDWEHSISGRLSLNFETESDF